MRTETVCITVENKDLAKVVWDFLLSKGYKEKESFREKRPYIWVNFRSDDHDWSGQIASADNRFYKFTYYFDAAIQMGDLIKFFTPKPAPPDYISTLGGIFYKDGSVTFDHIHMTKVQYEKCVQTRDAFLKQWADYNKESE